MKKSLKNKIDKEIDNYIDRSINILTSNAALAFITGEIKADKLMGTSFDKPSPDSLEYARDYKALLVDKGATIINGEEIPWLAGREKELRQQVYDSLEQGFKEGRKTYGSGSIADDIADILGVEHWKAQRIARTEVKRIMNAGTIVRYNRNNVKFVQVLDNEGDNSCDECAEINGQIWTVEYAQSHELQHPNCVRSFVPVFEEELPEDFVPDDDRILGQAPNPEFTKQLLQSKFSNMGKLRREDDLSTAQDKDKLLALKEYKSMYYSQHNRYLRRGEAGIKYHLKELGGFEIDSPDDRDYHMIKEYMEASKKSTDLIRELMRDSSVEKDTLASRGDRKSTRLNSSHVKRSRMPSSA
jgi:SPP1 gp7 family putative phage head morphogenesis protein